jgi:hypothetical protein
LDMNCFMETFPKLNESGLIKYGLFK